MSRDFDNSSKAKPNMQMIGRLVLDKYALTYYCLSFFNIAFLQTAINTFFAGK